MFDPATPDQIKLFRSIKDRWFTGNPVKLSINFEGQGITPLGHYQLGGRAGPAIDPEHVLHEMAHLVELEQDRLLARPTGGWGLRHGKAWQIGDRSGFYPQTTQQVDREARVWAYQASLMRELDLPMRFDKLVVSAVYLPAFSNCRYFRGAFRTERQTLAALARRVSHLHGSTHTFEKWEQEWNRRMELLRNA